MRLLFSLLFFLLTQVALGSTDASVAERCVQRYAAKYGVPPELVASFIDVESGWNQALFEAYLQYCFSPKHTVGEQLLDVRRCRLAGARAGAHGWPFRIAQYSPIQRVDGMLMAGLLR